MNRFAYSFCSVIILFIVSCEHDKLTLPHIDTEDQNTTSSNEAEYVQLNRVFDAASGYNFNHPADIYYGVDNFIYIADTDNHRIVMLDLGGTIQGYSQTIPHPEAISQNDSLQLLIVNKTNKVYKIELYEHNHQISDAPVEIVYEQASKPFRKFTGISVHAGFEYYVTVIDESVDPVESQIYDFYGNHNCKGPLPLNPTGTGLYSALLPTSIVSLRERYLDISSSEDTPAFIFSQTGFLKEFNLFNYYKVQYITTTFLEGQEVLTPNTSLVGSALYDYEKFYNPEDVAIDLNGNIFVVDAGSSMDSLDTDNHEPGFYRFGPTGMELQSVAGFGSGKYQFNNPKGIAISPNRELQIVYIADTGNNRIVRYQLSTDF